MIKKEQFQMYEKYIEQRLCFYLRGNLINTLESDSPSLRLKTLHYIALFYEGGSEEFVKTILNKISYFFNDEDLGVRVFAIRLNRLLVEELCKREIATY